MKSRLQRSSTALLVAMVGLSLVFGAGCTKKKKNKEVIETPDKEKSADAGAGDDRHASTDAGASSDAIDSKSGSSDFGSSNDKPADTFASSEPKDGVAPAGGSFEGLESRHGSAAIGGGDQTGDLGLTPAAPAPEGDELAAAPVKTPKKKKGKKKKKQADLEAPIETADAGDDAGVAAGPGGGYIVKKGDMMSKIAKAHGVSLKSLLSANKMSMDQAAKLKVGTQIKIPGTGKAD